MIIKDPKVARLFADQCRRDILHNLRKREMTPCQLARLLEKNVSSISHHLNVLEKAGLVKQTRTLVKGNLVEKFYRAAAKNFIISMITINLELALISFSIIPILFFSYGLYGKK